MWLIIFEDLKIEALQIRYMFEGAHFWLRKLKVEMQKWICYFRVFQNEALSNFIEWYNGLEVFEDILLSRM